MEEDVYFHKTVSLHIAKEQLEFRTSQALFSSYDIDTGTRFLLRSIIEKNYRPKSILDLGCGYGAIGLTLKKLHPESTVHMIDRDSLAIEYARQNSKLNGITNAEIYGSLGYDDVKKDDFDLIAANIPGKAGEKVIAYLLREAAYYLAPSGIAAIVVVAALEPAMAKILEGTPELEIICRQRRSAHTVFHYRFSGEMGLKPAISSLERGVYDRQNIKIQVDTIKNEIHTVYGLPEFDAISYGSEMLIIALNKIKGREMQRATIFNPGQGHVAVALWAIIVPENIELIDRDLLALRISRINLIRNGSPSEKISISHQVGLKQKINEKVDLIAGVLKEEGQQVTLLTIRQAAERLSPTGTMIVAGGSTAITRLVSHIEKESWLRIKARERRRGHSLLVLEKMI